MSDTPYLPTPSHYGQSLVAPLPTCTQMILLLYLIVSTAISKKIHECHTVHNVLWKYSHGDGVKIPIVNTVKLQ